MAWHLITVTSKYAGPMEVRDIRWWTTVRALNAKSEDSSSNVFQPTLPASVGREIKNSLSLLLVYASGEDNVRTLSWTEWFVCVCVCVRVCVRACIPS